MFETIFWLLASLLATTVLMLLTKQKEIVITIAIIMSAMATNSLMEWLVIAGLVIVAILTGMLSKREQDELTIGSFVLLIALATVLRGLCLKEWVESFRAAAALLLLFPAWYIPHGIAGYILRKWKNEDINRTYYL